MNVDMFSKVIHESFAQKHDEYIDTVTKQIDDMLKNPNLSPNDIARFVAVVYFSSIETSINSTLKILDMFNLLPDLPEDQIREMLIRPAP